MFDVVAEQQKHSKKVEQLKKKLLKINNAAEGIKIQRALEEESYIVLMYASNQIPVGPNLSRKQLLKGYNWYPNDDIFADD